MHLNTIDWIFVGLFFLVLLTIGLLAARDAGKNTASYFLSGRNMRLVAPWSFNGSHYFFGRHSQFGYRYGAYGRGSSQLAMVGFSFNRYADRIYLCQALESLKSDDRS